ncbi:class I SAM-dependent methyltransferase [Luteipulveratus flavus]|uniref:Class I SAM-dependent methyltransferase n=1 Tax=Luteipulveratus flavus TaxID=3031728 RepID=A0ABT6CBJ9_9MICO|nr:class I SAM-dependent methyltransferase [Luteipulveratus sp. YIM 133296]MDF8266170.1 class I SAM-dependent methyltransferase [Luteipulveratus sp. YIM 133296]
MSEPQDQVERVRAGYNALSRSYRGDIADGPTQSRYATWLSRLRDHVPAGGHVLDLGCGNGIPAAQWLVDNGYRVTGVDVSDEMVSRARTLVPQAEFVRADLSDPEALDFPAGEAAAVVALYSLIHIPLRQQEPLMRRIAGWLRPGGLLVATVGHNAWQGREQGWLGSAVEMWWSHPDASTYRSWIEDAGLAVVHEELVPEGSSGHQLIVARRG